MSFNKVGKFEAMSIVKEFDRTLIELYGVNMTDAGITRFDALSAVGQGASVREAVEAVGARRGMRRLVAKADPSSA